MPDKKITILDNIRRIFLVNVDEEYIKTNCRSNFITFIYTCTCLHGLYIGGSQSFSNQQGIRIFVSSYFFNGSLYVLAYPLCLNIRHRYCVTVKICISFVFIGQKCCVHSCVYRHSCMYARYVYESTYRVYSV